MPIKLVIVDSQQAYLDFLSSYLNYAGFTIVGTFTSGLDLALAVLEGNMPDIAIVEHSLPVFGGVKTALWIKEWYPSVKVVINALASNIITTGVLQDAGIEGMIIKKGTDPHNLAETLMAIHSGGILYE